MDAITSNYLTLSNLIDSDTGETITLDISGYTLPARVDLHNAGKLGREAGQRSRLDNPIEDKG